MKSGIVFVILALSTLSLSQNAFATNECTELLASMVNRFANAADPLQRKIHEHQSRIENLLKEYTQRLGPYSDPFAAAWSPEQGDRIFRHLSVRQKNGKWVKSSLAIINHNLKKSYTGTESYNEKLVQWIIEDAVDGFNQPSVERRNLQSHLLALKYTLEYLRRYREPEAVVDRDGKKHEAKKEEQKKQDKDQAGQDQPPEYPELPKEYKPLTKDAQDQAGGKQKPHRVAEVNFKTPFFAQRYFTNIVRGSSHPFQEAALSQSLSQASRYQSTERELTVRTFGKRNVDLFLPPGFKPLQPSDPRALISRSETGGYALELRDHFAEVHIPLIEDLNISMMPHLKEAYTRPVGFKTEEWPSDVQADIIRRYSRQDAKTQPLQVAQAIADHIATEYLYSLGPRSETDPIQALQSGAFQCDMAAYAMVGLLRDVYQIPSRVVGGFRAKKHQSGKDGKSYLVVPGEAHAWVEVFDGGKWHLFDPTPIKKDKKDTQKGNSEYSDNALENTPQPESEQQEREPSDSSSQGQGDGKQKQDHQTRLDENTRRRTGDPQKQEKQNTPREERGKDSEERLSLEELANQLELGSLELEPKMDQNVLLERAMRVLLQSALDPTQRGVDIQNRLHQISSLIRRFNSPSIKQIHQQALSAHGGNHPELKNWMDGLVRLMPGQDVNKTYQELHRIKLALTAYAKVLDRDGRIPVPERLIESLDQAGRRLGELAHPDSQDIGLVQDLVKNLPSVARQLLEQLYDFTQVGSNSPTKEVAKQLKSGKLNDLRLISILSPLSDFILNSTPRPETIEVKTWQRNSRRPRGQDLLPLQRFTDMARAILNQPGKTVEENMQEGTAFVPTRKQRVKISAGYGKEGAERITVVLFDTSSSMSGDPGRFQAGLISAFTGQALSDVSPSGRHRHRVVLVPFGATPGTPLPVTNTAEALDVIRNYQSQLKNTGGSTDIQKALLQGMSLIADAEKRSGEPLAAANIVLMTDGQAQVNSAELLQARKAIDRQTPLQTMFIAINETNKELMRFAMDSQSMGVEKGFYREFTAEHIKDILNEADHLSLKGRHDFYTDKQARDIPQEVYRLLDESLRLAADFSDQIYYGNQYISAREHLENLEKLKWRDVRQIDRPVEKWLVKVRQLVRHPAFQDKRILEKIVNDLVTHFEGLTGVQMNSLGDFEQEQLRHLIRYAAGLEEEVG